MKRYIFLLLFCLSTLGVSAQLKTPSLSPSASLSQTVGMTEIEVKYSRPSAKGRIIFAQEGLIPFGKTWRTGANAATKISFSGPVSIDGQTLEKGSYTVVTIPQEDFWQISWYVYGSSNWNSYLTQEAILTHKLPVAKTASYIETFEIHIQSISLDKANLVFEWENTRLKIPCEVPTQEVVLKNIERSMAGPNSTDYYQAALYLHESKLDLEKALVYIQKVTTSEKALFFQVTREALILQDLNRNKEAVEVAKRALILSEKVKSRDFVRINKQLIQALE